ncbi:aminoacyl-tRNA hydrolase [Candidatus Gracilibacteria bacterium]|nr:aminoacyl-tRNA hydrolase [Candidatus Gracilibacteria bacterium]
MNLSGLAVFKLLSYYKAEASDLIVIYDDIDLPVGKIRVRKEGSAGTHNGMKSIIQELGTNQFTRIRIGIEGRGTTSPQQQDLASYVLSRFSDEEEVLVDEALKEAMGELEKAI